MSVNRIIGLVLIAFGMALLVFGYNASQSVDERIVEGFTGRFTDQNHVVHNRRHRRHRRRCGLISLGRRASQGVM